MRLYFMPVALLTMFVVFLGEMASAQDLSFHLPAIDGKQVRVEKQPVPKLTVVCFLGTECPLARLYASRLNELTETYSTVDFVAIFSNRQDSLEDIEKYAADQKLKFPIIKDHNNVVANQYWALRTPEVFLVDQDLRTLYQGRIDDQYQPGVTRSEPTRSDLELALQQAIDGQPIEVIKTEPLGCLIGRVKQETDTQNTITYSNQVSRILQNHCSECHRAGEIGPMEFADYDEVIGWADMILEVVEENRMPPWHADPDHGEFLNERRMSVAEKEMLRDWVAAGTPEGDRAMLPQPIEHLKTTQWRLPKEPDLILEMRSTPFEVPAEGTIEYQYFVVDPKFETDQWITAAEIIPGDRSVVHHSIVFVRPPDGGEFRGIGWIAAYVPGQGNPTYNPKMGRRIPAGSKLVFQQHYTPTGKATSDLTRIGLLFGDETEIEKEVFTVLAMDQEFVIPPGDDNYKVTAQYPWLPKTGEILGASPHMHYRGKSFELTAEKEGQQQIVLKVPKYDFNWQHIYQFKKPLPTSEIDTLEITVTFDNSDNNPANPDSSQYVSWGDQTWEEMAIGFLIVAIPRNQDSEAVELTEEEKMAAEQERKRIEEKVKTFVDDFFNQFDTNQDGVVTAAELPRSVWRFGSREIDLNGDEIISREEVIEGAQWRFSRN